jgi:hypothetical protein
MFGYPNKMRAAKTPLLERLAWETRKKLGQWRMGVMIEQPREGVSAQSWKDAWENNAVAYSDGQRIGQHH